MTKIKRGPLSKAEMFYIEGKRDEMSTETIAEDLNRSKTTIENYLKKNPRKGLTVGDQFARQKGVTIMTENASIMSDETRSSKKVQKSCVTKIK